jgi:hypothetical protein
MSKRIFLKGQGLRFLVGFVIFAGALIAFVATCICRSHFLSSGRVELDSRSTALQSVISDTTLGASFRQSGQFILLGSCETYDKHTKSLGRNLGWSTGR